MNAPRLLAVSVGVSAPLGVRARGGNEAVASAIVKHPVSTVAHPDAVAVGRLGVTGDEQVDQSVHGGLDKAVYVYPIEHYAFWNTVRGQAGLAPLPPAGALGENLTLEGLLEKDVCVGDVLRFPGCELAVSEPRFPCFKFNAVMGFAQASKLMFANGWCGFYLSVRTPGTLRAGELFEVIHGPREVGIVELFRSRAAARKQG